MEEGCSRRVSFGVPGSLLKLTQGTDVVSSLSRLPITKTLFQGALAPHHHAQVGIPVGVVTLGLCGAMGPAGPARGEQPVNCSTRGKAITHLAWPSLLHRLPWAASELSTPRPQIHVPRWRQGQGKKHQSAIHTGNVC